MFVRVSAALVSGGGGSVALDGGLLTVTTAPAIVSAEEVIHAYMVGTV